MGIRPRNVRVEEKIVDEGLDVAEEKRAVRRGTIVSWDFANQSLV